LFNGNPLLRFDGYYILADLLEVPNMRQKASNVLQRFIVRICLGIKMPEDPFLPQTNRFLFGMYTVCAVIYRWFVVFSILWFLNQVFEPYGLKVIGQLIGLMGLFGLVIMPLWKFGKFLYVPGRMDQVKMPNVYASVGVMSAVVLGIAFIPIPHRVKCTVYVQPRDALAVYADVEGRLEEVNVKLGEQVEKGKVLGRMSNLRLELEVAELHRQKADIEIRLEGLKRQRFTNRQAGAQIPQLVEALAALEDQIEDKETKLRRLSFVALGAGSVMAEPVRESKTQDDQQLPEWSGKLFSQANRGAWMNVGDLFCKIGDPDNLEAVLLIDQTDVEFVHGDEKVWLKLDAYPNVTFESKIERIAESAMELLPPEARGVSRAHGGNLITVTDRSTGALQPMSTSYPAWAPLDQQGESLRIGMRGRGKIRTQSRTVGYLVWRFLAKTFNFDM
jgi:putative peptide zinc metalloprotease protein